MNYSSSIFFALSNLRITHDRPEIFTVTSGKGGVGKTNISVNLSILLSQMKKNVLLVDADIHLGNVDLILGIRTSHSIEDVLSGEMNLQSIILKGPGGIDVLPASSAVMTLLEMEDEVLVKLNKAFSEFDHNYDIIIVDTGSGITRNVMSFVLGADKIIVVVTPDPASIADAYGMIKVIKLSNDSVPIMLVTNMVRSQDEGESLYKKMNLMVERFLNSRIAFGGIIITDNLVVSSIQKQKPLVIEYVNTRPAYALKLIARNILRLPTKDVGERSSLFDNFISYRNITVGTEQ